MGKTKQKILIYSPYWQVLGGGEKYLLDIAKVLSIYHRVFLVADKSVKKKAFHAFGIDIGQVVFIKPESFKSRKFYDRFLFLRNFNTCFYMTDGSLFFPGAAQNYLIIQSPSHIPKLSLSTRFKISHWKIICYSKFMQKIIKDKIHKNSTAIPPAINLEDFKNNDYKKSKIFLSVGRFFTSFLHEKRHDFLIDFFKKNYKNYFQGWSLVICGNLTEPSGYQTLESLKQKVGNLPIFIKPNISRPELIKLFKKSSIYWHAAGYGADSKLRPEKLEHFGITTLEAMAAKSVPLVFSGGGQIDIVDNNESGFLWESESKFLNLNLKLLNNPGLLNKIAENAQKKSENFSNNSFARNIYAIV